MSRSGITLSTKVLFPYHTPSVFYNRDENAGGDYINFGRLECDLLNHCSAAVFNLGSQSGSEEGVHSNIRSARRLLDRLEELSNQIYHGGRHAEASKDHG